MEKFPGECQIKTKRSEKERSDEDTNHKKTESNRYSDAARLNAACTVVIPSDRNSSANTPVDANSKPTSVYIDSIDLLIMESFPVQVSAIVRGHLANGCTVLDDILVEQVDDQFVLTAATHQEGDGCTETLVPFEETVSLPVRGLGVGTYRVAAGDVSAEFTFDVENAEAGAGSVEYISKLRGTVTEIVQGSDGIQVTLKAVMKRIASRSA